MQIAVAADAQNATDYWNDNLANTQIHAPDAGTLQLIHLEEIIKGLVIFGVNEAICAGFDAVCEGETVYQVALWRGQTDALFHQALFDFLDEAVIRGKGKVCGNMAATAAGAVWLDSKGVNKTVRPDGRWHFCEEPASMKAKVIV